MFIFHNLTTSHPVILKHVMTARARRAAAPALASIVEVGTSVHGKGRSI
jgi:hypothetical protein